MQERLVEQKFPMLVVEIGKHETDLASVQEIVERLRREIETHPSARFLGAFDHFAHTRALPDGEIAPDVRDAASVMFCFGITISNPEVLALRPRSIGICDVADCFVISFLEPPMPIANSAMETWVRGLVRGGQSAASAHR